MALSFEESRKNLVAQAQEAIEATVIDIAEPVVATEDYGIATLAVLDENESIQAYAGESWTYDRTAYAYSSTFVDEDFSYVKDTKDIEVNSKQVNITQEENSQYIPFEINRYYDGYDLTDAIISIHYVNKNGNEAHSAPINVQYSSTKIRFGWLVDKNVTAIEGEVKFEIQATGQIKLSGETESRTYVWKTKPNGRLNILKSLSGNGIIEPDNTWMEGFLGKISAEVETVRNYSQQAQSAANTVNTAVSNAETRITNDVDRKLNNYYKKTETYTRDEIDTKFDTFDVSSQLSGVTDKVDALEKNVGSLPQTLASDYYTKTVADNTFVKSYDFNAYKTTNDVAVSAAQAAADAAQGKADDNANAISDINDSIGNIGDSIDDLTDKFDNYYTSKRVDEIIEEAVGNIDIESELIGVNQSIASVKSIADSNTDSIKDLIGAIEGLNKEVGAIDKSPKLSYDITYDEPDDEYEHQLILWEIKNAGRPEETREAKTAVTIEGGSGGGGGANINIAYVTTSPLIGTVDDKFEIEYEYHGTDSSGDIIPVVNYTVTVDGVVVETGKATDGRNKFDVTKHIRTGSERIVKLTLKDDSGNSKTKTWYVEKIEIRIESNFNDKIAHSIGPVNFTYIPYGSISKTVHIKLDGEELKSVDDVVLSGITSSYTIPQQEHGSHLVEAWITAKLNNVDIETNHVFKDIIFYDSKSDMPVIGCINQEFEIKQYDNINIEYVVYDPKTETPEVTLAVDGKVVSTRKMDSATDIWQFKSSEIGRHELTITCGECTKTLYATVTELDIKIEPVTSGLVVDFNPSGKTNSDTDRLWSNEDYSMTVSDNFDWVNGGYQFDENGDQYFCIKAGTSAEIDYEMFADDAKKNGKEFKLVFKTTNVQSPDARFLSCVDNTTENNHIGLTMDVHEAYVYGQAKKLYLPYSEGDIVEFEFNINVNNDPNFVPMVMGYEDGCSTQPMVYDDVFNFTQNSPKTISLGSDKCDLHIYRLKVYNKSLSDVEILNNFIADARNADEMIDRYARNQIYDKNGNLDPYVLAEKCPWLRVIIVTAPHVTGGKKYPVNNTTIEYIYKNGDPVLDNWVATDAVHCGQGTSSDDYGAAGRNMDFILKEHKDFKNKPVITLGDGTTTSKITLTRKSVPTNYLNFKINIASSDNANNPLLQKRYNDFNPFKLPYVREEGYDTSIIKSTMEFHNCVVFVREIDENLENHKEFADTDIHFYGIGNVGDSKKTDKTRLIDPDDKYECILEVMDVKLPLSDFPKDTIVDAMKFYKEKEVELEDGSKIKEKVYLIATNDNLGVLYEKIGNTYVLTSDTEVDLSKTYYVDILEFEDFSEDFTYGWRYIWEDGTDAENEEVFNYCKQKWIEVYRFITTSTDEEFKEHFGDYFVEDSVLYYYLFTTRYTMVDNHSKNLFFGYGKTGEVDENGQPIRKWHLAFDYDNDTALGINNYGAMVYRYGYETTDVDENGVEVFRESDSTFFCRIRDLLHNKLKPLYNTLETAGAWSASSLINQFDEWQSQWPEELWRIDCARKYIRTYNKSHINGKGDAQFLVNMAHGKKKYQRREYERNQEKFMASKYQSSAVAGDNKVTMRCAAPPENWVVKPNYSLTLTPYLYMYLNVEYSTGILQVKAEPNKSYTIPFSGDNTDIINVYGASGIKSLGDLSPLYLATIGTGPAEKLKELVIGNSTEGYDNPNFTTLTTGANPLLEKLNVENVSGLDQSLNLSQLYNLKELYAHGTNASGVVFADGGNVEIAELPKVQAISMKNLSKLTTLDIASYEELGTLTVENCSSVDLIDVLNKATALNRVRLTGIDWTIDDNSLLERLYKMSGIDKNGYNIEKSVLTGTVNILRIKQSEKEKYEAAWPELTINCDNVTAQHKVTFYNYDGNVIEVQYVDEQGYATVPSVNPTRPSTVEENFEFDKWVNSSGNAFNFSLMVMSPAHVYASYTSEPREYTVSYYTKDGSVLYSAVGKYNETVPYVGNVPTYTKLEDSLKYNLFSHWNKFGLVHEQNFDENTYTTGIIRIDAVFDEFQYTDGCFNNMSWETDIKPIHIYAITRLHERFAMTGDFDAKKIAISGKTKYKIALGNDVEYGNINSEQIISETISFNGTESVFREERKKYNNEIKLFDEDKDFVIAIDYEFSGNGVLAQCAHTASSSGFRLENSASGTVVKWGSSSKTLGSVGTGKREMLVVRHVKGDNNLYVYNSRLDESEVESFVIEKASDTTFDLPLVFGGDLINSQGSVNANTLASGKIHWAKVWFANLGDDTCKELAEWTHEKIDFTVSGYGRYIISGGEYLTTFSLLADTLLSRKMTWNTTSTTVGGWKHCLLNQKLNGRLYKAFPSQIRQIMKLKQVKSTEGNLSVNIPKEPAECYISVPSIYDLYSHQETAKSHYMSESEPGVTIEWISNNEERIRKYPDGTEGAYWTRSPYPDASSTPHYVWGIGTSSGTGSKGQPHKMAIPYNAYGVLIEISF